MIIYSANELRQHHRYIMGQGTKPRKTYGSTTFFLRFWTNRFVHTHTSTHFTGSEGLVETHGALRAMLQLRQVIMISN